MTIVIALIVVGAILLFLEIFLPGLVAGILGALCLIAGVVMGFVLFGPVTGVWLLMGVGVGLMVLTAVYFKVFPESRVAQRFVSKRTIGSVGAERPELLHQTGVAHTNLRPSGTALINGQRVDVVSEGGMIERGTPVRVVAIEGMRVVVRAV